MVEGCSDAYLLLFGSRELAEQSVLVKFGIEAENDVGAHRLRHRCMAVPS